MSELKAIRDALTRWEVQSFQSVADDGYAALSLTASGAQRFLDLVVPSGVTEDDELALRMVGRPSDLWVGAEEWRWHVRLGPSEDALVDMGMTGGLKMFVTVEMPEADLPEVLHRLEARSAG